MEILWWMIKSKTVTDVVYRLLFLFVLRTHMFTYIYISRSGNKHRNPLRVYQVWTIAGTDNIKKKKNICEIEEVVATWPTNKYTSNSTGVTLLLYHEYTLLHYFEVFILLTTVRGGVGRGGKTKKGVGVVHYLVLCFGHLAPRHRTIYGWRWLLLLLLLCTNQRSTNAAPATSPYCTWYILFYVFPPPRSKTTTSWTNSVTAGRSIRFRFFIYLLFCQWARLDGLLIKKNEDTASISYYCCWPPAAHCCHTTGIQQPLLQVQVRSW